MKNGPSEISWKRSVLQRGGVIVIAQMSNGPPWWWFFAATEFSHDSRGLEWGRWGESPDRIEWIIEPPNNRLFFCVHMNSLCNQTEQLWIDSWLNRQFENLLIFGCDSKSCLWLWQNENVLIPSEWCSNLVEHTHLLSTTKLNRSCN